MKASGYQPPGRVRWVDRENVHLTLKFLGGIDERQVQRVKEAMDTLKDAAAFRMDLSGIGAFPSVARPRVLWLGVMQSGRVKELFDGIESIIGDINREKRPFSAHITIGRVTGEGLGGPGAQSTLEKVRDLWEGKIISSSLVDRVVLFRSTLSPKGAVYRPLYKVDLKKEAL